MADPRERQQDEAAILQELIDQPGTPKSDKEADTGEDIIENEDGSATIRSGKKAKAEKRFYRNLAEELPATELQRVSTTLLKLIADDKKARELKDKQYEEGLKRMGLSKETIGGANFIGATTVAHPMYTQACIDFEARSIKEILPPAGPCREFVPGTVTNENTEKARRKAKWMNYLFIHKMPNFFDDMEQLLIQLPMAGDQYIKFLPPVGKFKIDHEWIPVDEMLLPEAATSYYAAERRTHIQKITALEFGSRVQSKFYRDVSAVTPTLNEEDKTKTEEAVDKITGNEPSGDNVDGLRLVYECDCIFQIPVEDNPQMASEVKGMPYLISIEGNTQEVLAIYRNWKEGDEDADRLEWAVNFPFIPFRGAYHIGFPHIIGGLAIAATGALRALLDSAHINNIPGLMKLKGPAGTGQTVNVQAATVTEVEGTTEVDDIRKLIMAMPFNPPSPVLFQLLGFLDTKGSEVVRTTLDESQDNANMPVGTQMMRIEQGMVVFSAIHQRLHKAMDQVLRIIHRFCETYLDDSDVVRELGEQLVTQSDFEGPCDVLPVSDPNVFCELQRYAQVQTVAQRAQLMPQVYDLRKVESLILKQMRLPNDGKDLLIPKPEPSQLNPVNENVALCLQRPIVAFPEQDHEAHIIAHCLFVKDPLYAMVCGNTPQSAGALMQHLKEHIAFWYAMKVHEIASRAASDIAKEKDPKAEDVDIGDIPQSSEEDPDVGRLYDRMLAQASASALQIAGTTASIKTAIEVMQQMQQSLQQMQPPPPMDPSQAAMAETNRKAQADRAKEQLQGQELQQQGQESQQGNQAQLQKQALADQGAMARTQLQEQTKMQITTQDNMTAEDIAAEKTAMGASTNVSDGVAVGKGNESKG